MITNERQYKITKSQIDKFRVALNDFKEIRPRSARDRSNIIAAQRASLERNSLTSERSRRVREITLWGDEAIARR